MQDERTHLIKNQALQMSERHTVELMILGFGSQIIIFNHLI